MLTRRKAPTLLFKATARERSSLAAVSAASKMIGSTMGRIGYKRRTLMTATAAVSCLIPFYADTAMKIRLVAGESPPRFWRSNANSHSNRTRDHRLYHTRKHPDRNHPQSVSSHEETPLLKVLQTLVRRLNEPVPLRANTRTTTTASTTTDPSSLENETFTVVEEKRRMAELADELVARYASLPTLKNFGMQTKEEGDAAIHCERSDILEFLATECCPTRSNVQTAVEDYHKQQQQQPNNNNNSYNYEKLKRAATPIFEGLTEFVLQQNAVTGMGFLVALREDLLSCLRYQQQQQQQEQQDEASMKAKSRQQRFRDLDSHLKSGIFQRWFVPGLLSHQRITYESTPANIIEYIATKEAVHPMKSLDDLKDRLGASKRVFALFHPCLPNQPLVFVHVALLSHGLPSSMEEIMASNNKGKDNHNNTIEQEQRPQVAAFYSISNGVKGLAGVGLGEYLLKESIHALKEELPCLQTFVTLSPIPKFRKWIKVAFLKEDQKQQQWLIKGETQEFSSSLLSKSDREALFRCGLVSSDVPFPWAEFLERLEETDFSKLMEEAKTITDGDIYSFLANSNNKEEEKDTSSMSKRKQLFVLRSVLLKLASSYLWLEKHRGKPLDKVCGFHVGNGAELHDLHFGADLSRGGLSNSYGIMVNYLYDTDRVSRNQANFESSGYVVPVGQGVRKWLEENEQEKG